MGIDETSDDLWHRWIEAPQENLERETSRETNIYTETQGDDIDTGCLYAGGS